MAITFTQFKDRLRALFGDAEDNVQTVEGLVGRAVSRWVEYDWARRAGTVANSLIAYRGSYQFGQTVSFSASQPIAERTVFTAPRACKVRAIYFLPDVSSTVTATGTMAWNLQVNKRKSGTTGSATSSFSQTFYAGGLTSDSTKQGTYSWSWSAITYNVQTAFIGKPNALHLATGAKAPNLTLDAKDILTARVRKGSGTATDSGAIFPGGKLLLEIEEI